MRTLCHALLMVSLVSLPSCKESPEDVEGGVKAEEQASPNLRREEGKEAKIAIAKAMIERRGPVSAALRQYKSDIGTYPKTDEGLLALFERPDSVDENSGKWTEPYLEGWIDELADPWGNPYHYRFPGATNEKEYELWSMGSDQKDGTDDDITSWKSK